MCSIRWLVFTGRSLPNLGVSFTVRCIVYSNTATSHQEEATPKAFYSGQCFWSFCDRVSGVLQGVGFRALEPGSVRLEFEASCLGLAMYTPDRTG